jgi:hypothetical protein
MTVMTAARTHVPQALADEIASIPTPADDNHLAVQAHDMDSLDNALAVALPDYGPEGA